MIPSDHPVRGDFLLSKPVISVMKRLVRSVQYTEIEKTISSKLALLSHLRPKQQHSLWRLQAYGRDSRFQNRNCIDPASYRRQRQGTFLCVISIVEELAENTFVFVKKTYPFVNSCKNPLKSCLSYADKCLF